MRTGIATVAAAGGELMEWRSDEAVLKNTPDLRGVLRGTQGNTSQNSRETSQFGKAQLLVVEIAGRVEYLETGIRPFLKNTRESQINL
jgi:hypothetical protein